MSNRNKPLAIRLIRLARPADWIKNAFVLAPVPFALADEAAGARFEATPFLLGLLGFCLVNSAVYVFNDLCDAAGDRLHPEKKHRPIASGEVSPAAALVTAAFLLVGGLALCWTGGGNGVLVLASVYIGANIAYSTGAKNVALLDVFLLTSGFVIRVLLGCLLVGVGPSPWLLLCTSSLALFLGFTKRRADLLSGLDLQHRPSLRGYNEAFLDQAMTITAGVSLVAYALYSILSGVLLEGREMVSMPFVAYGILNYLRLAATTGAGGSPVRIAYTSHSSQLCAIGWLVTVNWSLGNWSLAW